LLFLCKLDGRFKKMKGRRTYRSVFAVLAAVMLVQALGNVLFLSAFQLNRAYFAEQLCEQRTRPGNDCQGQCQLVKRLADNLQVKEGATPVKVWTWEALESVPPFENVDGSVSGTWSFCPKEGVFMDLMGRSRGAPATRPPARA
jgi:hypothetical protein